MLNLPVWPQRIECYDVAHLQGTDTAGAMVVFEQGLPKKKEYRRFQIRTSGNDDFASMQEMLRRRFKRTSAERAAQERATALSVARSGNKGAPAPSADYEAGARLHDESQRDVERGDSVAELVEKGHHANGRDSDVDGNSGSGDKGWQSDWAVLPDLLVIDGGKGQLSAAREALREAGVLDIPIISLAKREEHVFVPDRPEPVVLGERSEALRLLQRIRDEAHRFSNSYNRKLGSKRATRSKLDSVPLIGPVRKKALLRHFGSLQGIRAASIDDLVQVKGMDRAAAQSLKEHLG